MRSLLWLGSWFAVACSPEAVVSTATELKIEPTTLLVEAPPSLTAFRTVQVRLRNLGTTPIRIQRIELIENDETAEFSVASAEDWHTGETEIPVDEFFTLDVTWTPTDDLIDTARIIIHHELGQTIVQIRSADLTPQLEVITAPKDIRSGSVANVDLGALVFGPAISAHIDLRSLTPIPVTLDQLCLLNEAGACHDPRYDPPLDFELCAHRDDDADALSPTTTACEPPMLPPQLAQGERFAFSIRLRVTRPNFERVAGRVRIESDAANGRRFVIKLTGQRCIRTADIPVCGLCGNGVRDPGEECDDGNLDDEDRCRNSCAVAHCGDGYVGPDETCDDGNLINGDGCDSNCTPTACGNGVRGPGEQCDDGNRDNRDACLNDCSLARCGDGYVEEGVEGCDDGNRDEGDACTNQCRRARCGDGILQVGVEACDDGNDNDGDACRNECIRARCGDGVVHADVEECDDGNEVATDGCTNGCAMARCGDGLIYEGVEECDDGNASQVDDCLNSCIRARCGDGFVQANVELCDDGNRMDTDRCKNDCTPAYCGDGVIEANVEACDDGNRTETDACLNRCEPARCGDGVVHLGVEECDHGLNNGRDGQCGNDCLRAFECLISPVDTDDDGLESLSTGVCHAEAVIAMDGEFAGLSVVEGDLSQSFDFGPDDAGVLFGQALSDTWADLNGMDIREAKSCVVADFGQRVRVSQVDTMIQFQAEVCDQRCSQTACGRGRGYGLLGADEDKRFFWLGFADEGDAHRHGLTAVTPLRYLAACRLNFPEDADGLAVDYLGVFGTPTGAIVGPNLRCTLVDED
ncbi:MAG: DUF4215 domain-containing protein [Myxococcota bacterium]|nr:DUF4215 domain-containing protein [Myxococcota bacterium]